VINATKGGDSDNFFDYLNIGWSLANIQFK
jgi:hypothetical protein